MAVSWLWEMARKQALKLVNLCPVPSLLFTGTVSLENLLCLFVPASFFVKWEE
jgi:hypothetical protein